MKKKICGLAVCLVMLLSFSLSFAWADGETHSTVVSLEVREVIVEAVTNGSYRVNGVSYTDRQSFKTVGTTPVRIYFEPYEGSKLSEVAYSEDAVVTATDAAYTELTSGTVTITYAPENPGEIVVDVEENAGAPGVEIRSSDESIVDIVATPEELEAVREGDGMKIWLEVSDITEEIGSEARADLTAAASEAGYTNSDFLSLDLYKKLSSESAPTKVEETDSKICVTVRIPASMINTNSSITRSYCVVCYNNSGAAEIIPATYDAANETLTFWTDQFTEYSLAYKDTAAGSDPDGGSSSGTTGTTTASSGGVRTGDDGDLLLWSVLACFSAGSLAAGRMLRKRIWRSALK